MPQDNKLVNLFEEFLSIYKLINRKTIIDLLQKELGTEQLIEIYKFTDGIRSTRELASLLRNKCSHVKVAGIWNKWAMIGIVGPTETKGRYKAIFNLEEYGIASIDGIEEGE